MAFNVLITGIGHVLGIGILKALRISPWECRITGADCNPKSAGLYMVDNPIILPGAINNRQEYLKKIAAVCRQEDIHIILLGSEAEMKVFAPIAADFTRETGAFVMVSPADVINTTTDKWLTYEFLSAHGFPTPATIIPENNNWHAFARRYGYPLIIKPREGQSSKGLHIIENKEQLAFYANTGRNIILQEYVMPDDEEYTVGVFTTAPGQSAGSIVMRRELSGGLTFRAEVVQDEEIGSLCCSVAEKAGVIGPCNIQLRRTAGGPVILEINPRFSSTVSIRAHFGFNEPAMAVARFVLNKVLLPPRVRTGLALRYWEEQYIE